MSHYQSLTLSPYVAGGITARGEGASAVVQKKTFAVQHLRILSVITLWNITGILWLRSHIYKFVKNILLCSLKQCFTIIVVFFKRVNACI